MVRDLFDEEKTSDELLTEKLEKTSEETLTEKLESVTLVDKPIATQKLEPRKSVKPIET